MKVMQVVADGRPGGGTTHVLSLAVGLKQSGFRVALATNRGSYAMGEAQALGIEARGIDFFSSRISPRAAARLWAAIHDLRPDLLHVHGGRASFFLALHLGRTPGCPVVYTVHGYHFTHRGWPLRLLWTVAERYASSRWDRTVFVCDADRRFALAAGLFSVRGKRVVIRNGIAANAIPSGASGRYRLIGFLGRLTQQKDPLLFVETVRCLAAEGYTAKMIGGGEMEAQVRSLVQRRGLSEAITMLGSLPHGDALREIRDVSVLVVPSRWECIPIVIMEAMAMGIPVVAAGVAGIPEVIQSGVSGMLVPGADAESYAAALRRLAQDPDLRQQVVRRGLELVRTRFSHQRVASQHRAVYRSVLGLGQALGPRP
jgi:glycosyltransferase involved in cell wall biosynthesis